jgi:protein SCO1/2
MAMGLPPSFQEVIRMKNKLPLLLIGAIALITGVVASIQLSTSDPLSGGGSSQAESQKMAKLQSALKTSIALPLTFKTVPDFELLDVNAAPITQAVFDDRWSIVFFGFTHCPDVCPTTLQVMKNVVSKVSEQQQTKPQIVFVSIDPARDTSEIMKKYISFFDEDFVGITGDMNAVHALTRHLGIVASFTANAENPENYTVDHTASLLLIDPQKRVRAKISAPHIAETIVADYLTIIGASS